MKRIINLSIISIFLIVKAFSQEGEEYNKLYMELIKIVNNEFVSPITLITDNLIFEYGLHYGYGIHSDPFTGTDYFFNESYLQCKLGENIYSMTPGIVKDIIFDRQIIIEYNGIEISYRDLNINNIKTGDEIRKKQLLGTRRGVDGRHNYFNGIIIKIKYKNHYFDAGILLRDVIYYEYKRKF
jgi:hypothetical protein